MIQKGCEYDVKESHNCILHMIQKSVNMKRKSATIVGYETIKAH